MQTPSLYVFGMQEETRVPGQNPRRHREDIQTAHRPVQFAPAPDLGSSPKWTILHKHITMD